MNFPIDPSINLSQICKTFDLYGTKGHEKLCLQKEKEGYTVITINKPKGFKRLTSSVYQSKLTKQKNIAQFIYHLFDQNEKTLFYSPEKFDFLMANRVNAQEWVELKNRVNSSVQSQKQNLAEITEEIEKIKNRWTLKEQEQTFKRITNVLAQQKIDNVVSIKLVFKYSTLRIKLQSLRNKKGQLNLECQNGSIKNIDLEVLSTLYPDSYFGSLQNFKGEDYLNQKELLVEYPFEIVNKLLDILYDQPTTLSAHEPLFLLALLNKLSLSNHKVYIAVKKNLNLAHIIEALILSDQMESINLRIFIYDQLTKISLNELKKNLSLLSDTLKENLFKIEDNYIKGVCYFVGIGTPINYEQAFSCFELALKQEKNAATQNNLGICYYESKGVEKNFENAFTFFKLAAEQNHPEAQYYLAISYHYEKGIEKNIEKAIEYYAFAANQNFADAQFQLGSCYDNGEGVKENFYKAVEFYTLAAKQNHPIAQNNLARCYYTGKGIEKNIKHAFNYIKLAADQGYKIAQNTLGDFYQDGTGVEKDLKQAIHYYELAAHQGHKLAQESLKKLEET